MTYNVTVNKADLIITGEFMKGEKEHITGDPLTSSPGYADGFEIHSVQTADGINITDLVSEHMLEVIANEVIASIK